jgi:hypothetical protein
MLEDVSIPGVGVYDTDTHLARLKALTCINTDDMLGAIGLADVRWGRGPLEWLCRRPARRFARQVLGYDDVVGREGLAVGGAWALAQFVPGWTATGQAMVPRSGPLLIVSNHPGLYDTIALFAAIPRSDLLVIAADRPFLRALPHTSRHMLYLGDSPSSRFGLIRSAARHLKQEGAVLTFPGGEIEPDPAVQPGAVEALERWSASLDLFVRLAPRVTIVPAIVSGVLSSGAQRHPLTRIRRTRKGREWLGAMLQVIAPRFWSVRPRVAFGCPIHASEPATVRADVRCEILAEARRLIEDSRR